jgi:hypothetical protein
VENEPTRVMRDVCERCFRGDWQAMLDHARTYDPRNPVDLGKAFRDIIGTRNRTEFWASVTRRLPSAPSDEVAVDGDSVAGMALAVQSCCEGKTVAVQLRGTTIGHLIPVGRDDR